jgi:hypothetical protein
MAPQVAQAQADPARHRAALEAMAAMRARMHLERVSPLRQTVVPMANGAMPMCILAAMEKVSVVVFRQDARQVWIKPVMQFYP